MKLINFIILKTDFQLIYCLLIVFQKKV